MHLDADTKSLEVLLGDAVADNELACVASYVDIDQASFRSTSAPSIDTLTNGPTAVTVVPAPTSGKTRQVTEFTVYNSDTAPVAVTVRLKRGIVTRPLITVTLAVGATLQYRDGLYTVLEPSDTRLARMVPLGGSEMHGRTSAAWVRARGTQPVRINGDAVESAVASFQMRTTDAGTSVTCRVYNLTEAEVAGVSAAVTDTDEDFAQAAQRQRVALDLAAGECDYELQVIGGNALTDVIGMGHIEVTER